MAVNPMQRKARQSFLLGMLIMLVIAAIVVVLLFMQIMNYKESEEATALASKKVYVLRADIKSGEYITLDDLKSETIVTSIANNEIVNASLFADQDDENPIIMAKIDIPKGAILVQSMLTESGEELLDSLRVQEYNMLSLPSDLEDNDYVDIRLLFPNGQDYIVVSKKRVISSTSNTIFLKMKEEEILTMSNAIVESYISEGSLLYATKYVDAGIQDKATETYLPGKEVIDLIYSNPNIKTTALQELASRYNNSPGIRENINTIVSQNYDDYLERVQTGIDTLTKKKAEERAKYLGEL